MLLDGIDMVGLSAALDQSWLATSQRVFSSAAWESAAVAGSVQ